MPTESHEGIDTHTHI